MKAIVHHEYGPPGEVLELREIETPVPQLGEVLVRVRAASVQAGDCVIVRGVPYFMRLSYGLRRPKNVVAGFDVSGLVEQVGQGVDELQPGDEVFGWCRGGFAEFVCADAGNFVKMPECLTFEEAAAIPGSAIAALQALRDQAKVKAEQSVLVVGASGGVGTFAVQIAKSYGAEVTGVCSTNNVDMVLSIGADHVIDYLEEDFSTGGELYDVILDISGNRSLTRLRRVLAPRGTLVLLGGGGGPWFMGMGRTVKALLLAPFVSQRLLFFVATGTNDDLLHLRSLVEAGKLSPVIDRSYPLHETPEAVAYVDKGHASGKVVISVQHGSS